MEATKKRVMYRRDDTKVNQMAVAFFGLDWLIVLANKKED